MGMLQVIFKTLHVFWFSRKNSFYGSVILKPNVDPLHNFGLLLKLAKNYFTCVYGSFFEMLITLIHL